MNSTPPLPIKTKLTKVGRSVDDIIIFFLIALQIVLSMMSLLTPDYRKKKEAEPERGKFFRIGDRLISLFLRLLPLQIENCNYVVY